MRKVERIAIIAMFRILDEEDPEIIVKENLKNVTDIQYIDG